MGTLVANDGGDFELFLHGFRKITYLKFDLSCYDNVIFLKFRLFTVKKTLNIIIRENVQELVKIGFLKPLFYSFLLELTQERVLLQFHLFLNLLEVSHSI